MERADLPTLRRVGTYVLPRWKLVFVSNPKCGCTSIKWLLARLQGIEPRAFLHTLDLETTRDATIHRERHAWGSDTPRLADLSDHELAQITPDHGWFCFTTRRHPAARLWSAWQSKLLLREPQYTLGLEDEPWYPRVPQSTEHVLEDWHRFVARMREGMPEPLASDIHFRPQATLLGIGTTPYDGIYDTGELGALEVRLATHVRGLGWSQDVSLGRRNETPLPALAAAFTDGVLDAVESCYEEDYRLLAYERGSMPRTSAAPGYPSELMAAVGMLVERHERILDLTRLAREYRDARGAAPESGGEGSGGSSAGERPFTAQPGRPS